MKQKLPSKEKNSANIELHFWIIHEILPILNGVRFSSLSFSFSFAPLWINGSVRVENQWKNVFFRWLCYIRKNSLPKERQVLAKNLFLIRTFSSAFFLFFLSTYTHTHTPFHFDGLLVSFFSFENKKKSHKIAHNWEKGKNSWKENKRNFFAHRHSKKMEFLPKNGHGKWVFVERFFQVKLTNDRNFFGLTTSRYFLKISIFRRNFSLSTINLPVAKLFSDFLFLLSILWRWSPRNHPCCCFFVLESLFFPWIKDQYSRPRANEFLSFNWEHKKSFCWAFWKFLLSSCVPMIHDFSQGYFAALAKITFVAISRTQQSLNPLIISVRV